MTLKELLNVIRIKHPTSKIIKNSKIIQVLNYYNEHNVDHYEHDFHINEASFLILLENIH